jgi:membrane-associated phospholipid phosphatase
VHYPLDVLVGGLIGVVAALVTGNIFNRKVGSFTLE